MSYYDTAEGKQVLDLENQIMTLSASSTKTPALPIGTEVGRITTISSAG